MAGSCGWSVGDFVEGGSARWTRRVLVDRPTGADQAVSATTQVGRGATFDVDRGSTSVRDAYVDA
jgi:hypothetical protein